MKHELKSANPPKIDLAMNNVSLSNYADPENKRFLIVNQKDAERAQARVRRTEGREEIQQKIADLGIRKGFGSTKINVNRNPENK